MDSAWLVAIDSAKVLYGKAVPTNSETYPLCTWYDIFTAVPTIPYIKPQPWTCTAAFSRLFQVVSRGQMEGGEDGEHTCQIHILWSCPEGSEDFGHDGVCNWQEAEDATSAIVDQDNCQRRLHVTCIHHVAWVLLLQAG